MMHVLWTHNFDPALPNSQVFMNIAAAGLRARGVDLQCEFLGNLRSVRTLLAARRRVRTLAPAYDVVHAQYGSACALATSAVEGMPKVVSIRGNDWNVHEEFGFHYVHTRLARMMTRSSLSRYDAVVTVSRRVAADVQAYSPTSRIVPMPSPIDLARFVPRDKREARRLLGFPDSDHERWVLFNAINLADPIKRFALAKRAFDLANERCGNLRLRIATDLRHADVPLFTAACDVILCTSETEGWPNSVKEALACNVPFVSTDVSDLRDIAREEPSCRVCPDDADSLASSLCDVVGSPVTADLRRHVEPMGIEALSTQLISLYESLLSRRRSNRPRADNH